MQQFSIASHYDVMAQLDRDVHDDDPLSTTEVDLALALIGSVPSSVLLPCFGTGRHVARLLERGVKRIVGVDLSPRCVEKARQQFGQDARVELVVGDLVHWQTSERFAAGILLGNSFGDIIDRELLGQVTAGMVAPIASGGTFVMDYIGEGYLPRARARRVSQWDAVLNGVPVRDRRTPRFDEASRVLSIDVEARSKLAGDLVWKGCYQKVVLSDAEVVTHFAERGVALASRGVATDLNRDYYHGHEGDLGMIARSAWWLGQKAA